MPNTNRPLPIPCPKCHHDGSTLVAMSQTIITVTCASCRHSWATELDTLPLDIQVNVQVAVEDDRSNVANDGNAGPTTAQMEPEGGSTDRAPGF